MKNAAKPGYCPSPVWSDKRRIYVAVPEGVPLKDDHLTEDAESGVDSKSILDLSVDLETAQRMLALHLHLDDWTCEIDAPFDDHYKVNPHNVPEGPSPFQIQAKVHALKRALSRTIYAGLDPADLMVAGVHAVIREIESEGSDCIDALEGLLKGDRSYLDAWMGHLLGDGRPLHEVCDGEYLVLAGSEADKRLMQKLTQHIEDVILPEIPEQYRAYFDQQKWVNDQNRGDWLATDGLEHRVETVGGSYFIYRIK